tara:strand:- start:236 stop:364 length:129 start_codon:yes stop_codon:yes gene_type:complete
MEEDKNYYAVFKIVVYPELADEFWYAVRKLNGVHQVLVESEE